MTNPNDPAFPNKDHMGDGPDGLSKREWFAGVILGGLCARVTEPTLTINGKKMGYDQAAIAIADSIIAELSKEVKA